MKQRVERERKQLTVEIKKNFMFIEGANQQNKMQSWRFEKNIKNKILRPAETITNCQHMCVELLKQNSQFGTYLDFYKRALGARKP